MVRLKDGNRKVVDVCSIWFQFHYGTIKSKFASDIRKVKSNFNSTMVRLKGPDKLALYRINIFQFHYGTIKRKHEEGNKTL